MAAAASSIRPSHPPEKEELKFQKTIWRALGAFVFRLELPKYLNQTSGLRSYLMRPLESRPLLSGCLADQYMTAHRVNELCKMNLRHLTDGSVAAVLPENVHDPKLILDAFQKLDRELCELSKHFREMVEQVEKDYPPIDKRAFERAHPIDPDDVPVLTIPRVVPASLFEALAPYGINPQSPPPFRPERTADLRDWRANMMPGAEAAIAECKRVTNPYNGRTADSLEDEERRLARQLALVREAQRAVPQQIQDRPAGAAPAEPQEPVERAPRN